jgi:hypothetical protein
VEKSAVEEDEPIAPSAEKKEAKPLALEIAVGGEDEGEDEKDTFVEVLLDEDFKEKKSSAYQRFLKQILKIRTTSFATYEFVSNGGRPYIYKFYQERKS